MKELDISDFRVNPTLELDLCCCNLCGWYGEPDDCEYYMDSEGWEYPEYAVYECPQCGDEELEFYPSDELLKRMDNENL